MDSPALPSGVIRSSLMRDHHSETWLCESCREVNLDEVVSREITDYWWGPRENLAVLWSMNDVEVPGCALCEFLKDMRRRNLSARNRYRTPKDGEEDDEAINGRMLAIRAHQAGCYPEGSKNEYVFATVLGSHPYSVPEWRRHPGLIFLESSKVKDIQSDESTTMSIDYARIRDWLAHCKSSHGPSCHQEKLGLQLQVFDCQSRELMNVDTSVTEYVALSYVWGSKADAVKSRKEVSSELPLTIEDAVRVTLQLGLRYLWVDRYCIDQQDKAMKHILIKSMGQIYASAAVTLIAACGDDPHHGLPGVSRRPQLQEQTLTIGSSRLVFAPNIRKTIMDSTWNTRAWTLQEGLFSTRRLVFTDHQIYFQCGSMCCLQSAGSSLEVPIINRVTDDWKGLSNEAMHNCLPEVFEMEQYKGNVPSWIEQQIPEYRSRHLSFESDILNAFAGFFEHFKQPHILGLMMPCINSRSTTISKFAYGLFNWNIVGQDVRRHADFPSWTWAGWSGGEYKYIEQTALWEGWTWEQQEDVIVGGFNPFKTRFPLEAKLQYETTTSAASSTRCPRLQDLEVDYDAIVAHSLEPLHYPRYLLISTWTFDAYLTSDPAHPDHLVVEPEGPLGRDRRRHYCSHNPEVDRDERWLVDGVPLSTKEAGLKVIGLVVGDAIEHEVYRNWPEGFLYVLFVRAMPGGYYERVIASKIALDKGVEFLEDEGEVVKMRVGFFLDMYPRTIRLG